MSAVTTLKQRVQELIAQHGTLRGAARALQIDPGYLSRIERGEKDAPSDEVLCKMGLRRVVAYERTAPPADRSRDTDGG